jgi:zinc protease
MMIRSTLIACTAALFWVGGCRSEDAASPAATLTQRTAAPAPAPAAKKSAAPSGSAAEAAPAPDPATPANPGAGSGYGAEKYRLVNQRDEIVSVLENGLTVIAKRVSSPAVTVRAYVFAGGVYEGKWLGGGLSHLLEHLVAGGTTERRTEAQNRDLLQQLGNDSNAYTTTDHTAYFVNTTTERMADAVDLVAGWMLGAKITPDEYRREYEVVQRELEMGKGEPDRVFEYLADMTRYRVSPARVPVIGYQAVIQSLSRDEVYEYYKLAYQPNNMVFAVAGDVDPEKMLAAVQKWAGAKAPGRVFSHDIAQEPPVTSPRTTVATFPKLGPAKLRLGFPTVSIHHPDLYALDLLAQVLGGSDSSVLVEEIRDKKQLVSAIGVSDNTPTYADGTFQVDMELDPKNIAAATDAVIEQLDKVKEGALDEQYIQRAKTLVKSNRVRQLQTPEGIGSSMATDFLGTGDPHFSDRYVARMQDVSAVDLARVAKKYFGRDQLLTVALVPAEYVGAAGLPRAEDILRGAAPTTQPKEEQPASQIVRSELPNGTILLTKRIATSPLVVMQMLSLGGLTAEDDKTNGLGNLTMEMLPRGTKTRSAKEIAEFFDSIGGEIDTGCASRAFGANSWYWSSSCLKGDFAKAMEVYADVVNNPAFPDTEVEAMKRRVLAQIAALDADWLQQSVRFFKKSFYGPTNSPYQFLAVGTPENLSGFTQDQMRQWYDGKVMKGRKVLAIFGDVDPEQAKQLATKLLGQGNAPDPQGADVTAAADPAAGRTSESGTPGKAAAVVQQVAVQKTEQALAGVVIGYRAGPYYGDPANDPLTVADAVTSGYGYPTGYLHEILRGRGLVYVVHALNSPGLSPKLPGTFFVYAGCDPKNVNEVVDVILENIARLQGKPEEVNTDWFQRSKDMAIVGQAMELQTPAEQAAAAALDELYKLGYDYHLHFADRVRKVTLPDVQAAARQRLVQCVVTVSTPAPELVKVKEGRREYDAFPPVDLTPRGVQHDTGGK